MEVKTDWNLKLLFENDNSPEIELEKNETEKAFADFMKKWKENKDYLENPEVMKEALDDYELLMRKYGELSKVVFYFFLRNQLDMNNPEIKAKNNIFKEISKKLGNEIRFFTLNISKISESEQKKFIDSPELKDYKHFLETSFLSAKYLLSESEERILSLKQEVGHQKWEDLTQAFLAKSEREVINESGVKEVRTFSDLFSLIDSKKKEVRDYAAKELNDIFYSNLDIAEVEINAILENKKIDDELRKTERPDTLRFLDDDVNAEIVDTLVGSVTNRFDIARRYYELKAKLMGFKKLEYHERNIPYGKIENNYDFKSAGDIVYRVFEELDEEFLDIYVSMLKNGQVDVFPKKGKMDGGFCAGKGLLTPTYILLNYDKSLNEIKTLAHEFGHAINREFMRKKLNALNIGTPKSTAEVASIFMEDFVYRELLNESDEETKLAILLSKLNADINTVFRQIAFYNFEKELHSEFRKKGYLSKEEIGKIFSRNTSSYMGDFVEQSKGSENWWIYVPHFRYFFYVYSYSMGSIISKFLQSEFRKDASFIKKVKEFLSSGTSDSPKNIFLKLGIDITKEEFWNSGLDEVEFLLNETEALAKKLGKI